jgi:hypothetical protein
MAISPGSLENYLEKARSSLLNIHAVISDDSKSYCQILGNCICDTTIYNYLIGLHVIVNHLGGTQHAEFLERT